MPWIVPVLAAGAAAFAAKKVWDHYKKPPPAWERARATTARKASEGELVKIEGRAQPVGPLLTAPLSGRSCVAWRVEFELFQKQSPTDDGFSNPSYWVSHAHEESRDPFGVTDDSGQVLVPASKLEWAMSTPWLRGELSSAETSFLASRGHGSGEEYRRREEIIAPGDPVTVVGVATWSTAPDAPGAGYRARGKIVTLDAPEEGWIELRK